MSAGDFHCDHDGCKLHYMEPCDICTKCFFESNLPFCQHVCNSPDIRHEEYAKAQSSFYSDSYTTETSDDNMKFPGSDRYSPSLSLDLAACVDTRYQRQSSARSMPSSSCVQLSFSATPTISVSVSLLTPQPATAQRTHITDYTRYSCHTFHFHSFMQTSQFISLSIRSIRSLQSHTYL